MSNSDRSPAVLRNLAHLYGHGRLAASGYLCILPVDRGVEHQAGTTGTGPATTERLAMARLRKGHR